jgi:hypothetical protein
LSGEVLGYLLTHLVARGGNAIDIDKRLGACISDVMGCLRRYVGNLALSDLETALLTDEQLAPA